MTSEPIGEGANEFNAARNADINGIGGGGGHFLEKLKILTDFGAGDDFLDPSRVESIDKGSIFGLDTTTYR